MTITSSLSLRPLSAYIGNNVSVGHDALIHGPLGNHTFIGFKAIVYNAIIGKGSFISYNALSQMVYELHRIGSFLQVPT
ncbi:LbetaH domain-containing protein [Bacillus velezensis]|uniref:hypothetical protein n=1 Tax=Bacillus velezensis TaxID=492670 RepID=UPI001F445897|nr:hypothetical protein [Bacillus velezensis]